ncbi:MAG: hypothetical protein Q9212_002846 [Teloschistes hypoglaucus]
MDSAAKSTVDTTEPSSRLFTISVGPEKREFTIAENLLRKSPVFARMCDGDFKESHEGRINLPEDNPDYIENIIIYLNTGQLGLVGCPDPDYPANQLDHQWWKARFYLTVDKYGLEEMKEPMVTSRGFIRGFIWNEETMDDWLRLVEEMYEVLPADDVWYRWLVNLSVQSLKKTGPPLVTQPYGDGLFVLDKWIEKGGRLAREISLATRERLTWDRYIWFVRAKDLEGEIMDLKRKAS